MPRRPGSDLARLDLPRADQLVTDRREDRRTFLAIDGLLARGADRRLRYMPLGQVILGISPDAPLTATIVKRLNRILGYPLRETSKEGQVVIRSALAILAGILTLTAVSFGIEALADPLLMKWFPEALPTRSALSHNLATSVFMFTYGALSVASGGYVTAWLARRAPLQHALSMGVVQFVLTLWAMTALWGHAPAVNWIVSLAIALPAAALGGWLFAQRARRRPLPSSS
jgi:hypothetical protein